MHKENNMDETILDVIHWEEDDGGYKREWDECPNCGRTLWSRSNECPECGQKLRW